MSLDRRPGGSPSGQGTGKPGAPPIRILVVDDSAVIRGIYARSIKDVPDLELVASVGDGLKAIDAVKQYQPEVAILDIEMPRMDGLTALPKMLEVDPTLQIIMASTLTLKNASISMKALSAGAKDYVSKPTSATQIITAAEFRAELLDKVRALGLERRRRVGPPKGTEASQRRFSADRRQPEETPAPTRPGASARPAIREAAGLTRGTGNAPAEAPVGRSGVLTRQASGPIQTRPMPGGFTAPDVIAIGSSTGGPQALFKVLDKLPALNRPILITQHMPPTFTTILAEHLSRVSGWSCVEGKDGDPIRPGHIYLAPGDHHMMVSVKGGAKVLEVTQDPPENFCRPAVDPMLRSVVAAYGRKVLTIILTGMGQDGKGGCEKVVEAGGVVIAQDQPTSVVWGMPGAVAQAGLANHILPIDEIGPMMRQMVLRSAA
ncbi:MAG: chemotaxis response regulator protein-glutamate methylesterase [Alphaproteobacteria bacterium]|nr:chemotaxis response regulator protein-glutamate methylesterase [Alphaproteobacteria bacterium]